jgi:hypothetical protein
MPPAEHHDELVDVLHETLEHQRWDLACWRLAAVLGWIAAAALAGAMWMRR